MSQRKAGFGDHGDDVQQLRRTGGEGSGGVSGVVRATVNLATRRAHVTLARGVPVAGLIEPSEGGLRRGIGDGGFSCRYRISPPWCRMVASRGCGDPVPFTRDSNAGQVSFSAHWIAFTGWMRLLLATLFSSGWRRFYRCRLGRH